MTSESNSGYQEDIKSTYQILGRATSWTVCFLLIAYALTTSFGFLSLASSEDPIGDPYFTVMEILIIVVSALMVVVMAVVHVNADHRFKVLTLVALLFMVIMTGITSCVHFVILTMRHSMGAAEFNSVSLLMSFEWPSVVYALDILAWDWFFALSMLCAAPIFRGGRLENALRAAMIASGLISLVGLVGVPLQDMQIRNIGVIGYAVVAPVVFFLLGLVFRRSAG